MKRTTNPHDDLELYNINSKSDFMNWFYKLYKSNEFQIKFKEKKENIFDIKNGKLISKVPA